MKETILITGGAGFIGSHTADALRKEGYRIRILDNLARPVHDGRWPAYIRKKDYELMRGDVREKSTWARALRGVSYVYHIAAYQDDRPDFSAFFKTNTVSTALLYELIALKKLPVKKVILASSQFVYGDGKYKCMHAKNYFYPELRTFEQFKHREFDIICPHLPARAPARFGLRSESGGSRLRAGGKPARFIPFREDQYLNPTNSYGLSKQALENLAFRLGKTYDIPTVALRYSIVQGERQSPRNLYSGALRIFITQALHTKPITVHEDGMQTRDFVNIHDVVRANLLVLKNKKANFNVYNVGGGTAHRVLYFAKMVKRISKSRSEIIVGGFMRTTTRHAVSDISKIKKLGWRPRFGIERSIRDYISWYKENFDK